MVAILSVVVCPKTTKRLAGPCRRCIDRNDKRIPGNDNKVQQWRDLWCQDLVRRGAGTESGSPTVDGGGEREQ